MIKRKTREIKQIAFKDAFHKERNKLLRLTECSSTRGNVKAAYWRIMLHHLFYVTAPLRKLIPHLHLRTLFHCNGKSQGQIHFLPVGSPSYSGEIKGEVAGNKHWPWAAAHPPFLPVGPL